MVTKLESFPEFGPKSTDNVATQEEEGPIYCEEFVSTTSQEAKYTNIGVQTKKYLI
jgi:hypothetical protein